MFTMGPPLWGGDESDPYWSYVKALLHFDGNYVDSSPLNGSYVSVNGAVINSSDKLYGSGALDCVASDSSNCAGGSFLVGASDLCVELFFKDNNVAGGNQYFYLMSGSSQSLRLYSPAFGGDVTTDPSGVGPAGTVAYSYGVWNHSAITRSGNNWIHWFNGVAAQTWTNSTFNIGTVNLWIGSGSSSNSGRKALIDGFRVTVGVPRYTAPFTPRGPFPNR